MAACQRALAGRRQTSGCADAAGRRDVAKAQQLLTEVAAEGTAVWKIQTTLSDLQGSVDGHADETVRRQLSGVLTALEALLPPVSPAEPGVKDPPS